jgi:aldose 1-epimerase
VIASLRLTSPDGALEADFAPELNFICSSVRHRGAEVLGQRDGLGAYRDRASTLGVPLLHPWANRLSASAYTAAGREVRFDPGSALVKLDANELPIHGVVPVALPWTVEAASPDRLAATLDFRGEALEAIFPFPHMLRTTVTLGDDTLRYVTTLRPTTEQPVPVALGWHPYLTVPGVPREEWKIELPVGEHVVLDERSLPTGRTEPVSERPGPLGDRTFDDGYVSVPEGATFVVQGGGRRLALTFERGCPCAQVYAPAGEAVIAYEPMTAPTDALVTGDRLPVVGPGEAHEAAFSLTVR